LCATIGALPTKRAASVARSLNGGGQAGGFEVEDGDSGHARVNSGIPADRTASLSKLTVREQPSAFAASAISASMKPP